MFRVLIWSAVTGLLMAGTTGAASLVDSQLSRPDCPGKIVCPLTGEEVCKDLCPLQETARDDCPGKVLCPLTGEPVCVDRCPLQKSADKQALPPCCRKKAQ